MIGAELEKRGAPRDVQDAGNRIDKFVEAGVKPPVDLVQFVQRWVGSNQAQDKYGH